MQRCWKPAPKMALQTIPLPETMLILWADALERKAGTAART